MRAIEIYTDMVSEGHACALPPPGLTCPTPALRAGGGRERGSLVAWARPGWAGWILT